MGGQAVSQQQFEDVCSGTLAPVRLPITPLINVWPCQRHLTYTSLLIPTQHRATTRAPWCRGEAQTWP